MTSDGYIYKSLSWFKDVPIKIQNFMPYTNLIEINMADYGIILGIYWLSIHYVIIDYQRKHVHYSLLRAKPFKFQGTSRR